MPKYTVFSQSDTSKPGTWKEWDTGSKHGVTACLTCPKCGNLSVLMDHSIDKDGVVSPSVVCPTEGCSFHEFVKLEGWQRGAY